MAKMKEPAKKKAVVKKKAEEPKYNWYWHSQQDGYVCMTEKEYAEDEDNALLVLITPALKGEQEADEVPDRVSDIHDDMKNNLDQPEDTVTESGVDENPFGGDPIVKTEKPEKKKGMEVSKHALFSKEAIDEAVERSEKFAEFKPDAKPGPYPDAIFEGAELEMSKQKSPMIVIAINLHDDFAPLKEWNVFPDTNMKVCQVSQNKCVDFMLQGFGYTIAPVEGSELIEILSGIIDQMNKYKGKKLAVAVKGEPDVYAKTEDDGSTTMVDTIRARLWYVREHGTDLHFNPAKAVKVLSAKEKQKLAEKGGNSLAADINRPLTDDERADIENNPLLSDEDKKKLLDKGVTAPAGDKPLWATQ